MDVELFYAEKGRGAPFLMLHGNGESHGYFERQTAYFADKYRVITPDTRGHGASPRGEGPFTLSRFADDLKDFMDGLGIARAIILGFSDGGNIALLFALKYPQYVEKLIVDGADLSPEGVKAIVQIPIVLLHALASFAAIFFASAIPKKEMLGLMVGQPDIKPAELKQLKMPTLIMAGTADLIKRSHTELIQRSIPNSRLAVIKGTHFCARDNSAEFNRAVGDFLDL